MTTTTFKRRFVPLLLAASFGAAVAAPIGQQVVAGQASFSQQGNVFSITNTPGTIINWQSFSINPGEITRFLQQSADSAVLNRIVGQDPSRILGALQSNGKVFLINPNGIVFGRDARVDVNGLVASTLNLSNADFLAGKKNFQAGAAAGDIRNEGTITTPSGGQVFLIAPNVGNTGIITSPQGEVVLAAGRSVRLVDARDPDLHVVVSAPDNQAINLGQVVAQSGKVGIYGALINQRGVVNADSAVVGENGKIVLKASRETLLERGSVTSATGAGKGGEIHLLGERVALNGDAAVDASGIAGGGTVLVGGDWQGQNAALPNARQTFMGKDASIKADALVAGDGGKVVLWSDESTSAFGSISAQGGALGGDGGKVETSGHYLDVIGVKVNAGAAKGKGGNWLLDPYDIEVVEAGSTATPRDVASPEAGPSSGVTKIAPSVLTGTNADIILQAVHDITVTDAISTSKSLTATAGNDINVNANVTSTAGDIQFNAGRRFYLGTGAGVKGDKNIDVIADQINLAGAIGRATAGSNLIVSLNPQTAALPIRIGGSVDGLVLRLDPSALSNISAYELNVGTSRNTGGIFVNSAFNPSGHFVMGTAGKIEINAPVTLGATGSFIAVLHGDQGTLLDVDAPITARSVLLQGDGLRIAAPVTGSASVTLAPHSASMPISLGQLSEGMFSLDAEMLRKVNTPALTIGGQPGQASPIQVLGAIDLTSHPFGSLNLDAGGAQLILDAPLVMPSGVLSLIANGSVYQNSGGGLTVGNLRVQGGRVVLSGPNSIGTLAGSSDGDIFRVNATGPLAVGTSGGMTGVSSTGGRIELVTDGLLTIGKPVDAGSGPVLLRGTGIAGNGKVKGNMLMLDSTGGIGLTGAPLNTETQMLLARNNQVGDKPISIANTGDVVLVTAAQIGETPSQNTGSITINNTGNMTVRATSGIESNPAPADWPDLAAGEVRTGAGGIILSSTSAMTVGGKVATESGNISLTGGNGVTVGGQVTTGSGNIRLEAANGSNFATLPGAAVASSSGTIDAVAGTASISEGTIPGAPGKVHLTLPPLEQCAADPSLRGCEPVLPKPDFCATHKIDPSCQVSAPAPSNGDQSQHTLAPQVVKAAVNLINATTANALAIDGSTASGAGPGASLGNSVDGDMAVSSSSSDSDSDEGFGKQSDPVSSEHSGAKK